MALFVLGVGIYAFYFLKGALAGVIILYLEYLNFIL